MTEPSLFSQYKKEREGVSVLERPEGFATFKMNGEAVYLFDIFVAKESRRTRVGSEMANEICAIAKAQGCKKIFGSCDVRTNGSTESMKAMLAYGFRLVRNDGVLVWLEKEL